MSFFLFFVVLVPIVMYLGLSALPQGRTAFIACGLCFAMVLPLGTSANRDDVVSQELFGILVSAVAAAAIVQFVRLRLSPGRPRMRYPQVVLAVGSLLGVILILIFSSAATAKDAMPTSVFPSANGGRWQARAIDFGQNTGLRDYAIAPDRKSIFALVLRTVQGREPFHEIRVLDLDGKLLRKKALRKDEGASAAELFFTDQAELVWNDDKYFHFIDPATLSMTVFPQCRATDYPLRAVHLAEAKKQGEAWRDTELKALRDRFGLSEGDAKRSNQRVPSAYWDALQKLYNDTPGRVEQVVHAQYLQTMLGFAEKDQPKTGLRLELQAGTFVYSYARLNADGAIWYCNLEQQAQRFATRWSQVLPASGVTVHDRHVGLGAAPHFVDDGGVRLVIRQRIKTGGSSWDPIGGVQFDYIVAIEGLGGPGTNQVMRFVGAPPKLARDLAFRLDNGQLLWLVHKTLYLVEGKGP